MVVAGNGFLKEWVGILFLMEGRAFWNFIGYFAGVLITFGVLF